MTNKHRAICPRCDGQGLVRRVQIDRTGEVVSLCDECDALWPAGVEVSLSELIDFSSYAHRFGFLGLWTEITVLDD